MAIATIEPKRRVVAARELLARRAARRSLLDFTCYTKSDFQVKPFHQTVAEYLERWIAGDIPNLILNMPPQHGKTEQAERRLSAYILGRYPDVSIINAAYSAPLARETNRDIQNIMVSPEYKALFPDTTLSDEFVRDRSGFKTIRTTDQFGIVGHSGSYRSAGILGGIGGFGAHFLIIGDPIKNYQEAYSHTYRESVWNEFEYTLNPRLRPFLGIQGRKLITTSRWHKDDLAGRCIDRQRGEGWVVLNFPAIAPSEPAEYDKRRPGEALWPERYPKEYLLAIRKSNARGYAALYDGSPQIAEGNVFKRDAWQPYKQLPAAFDFIVQSLDTAFKEKQTNDYTVIETWGVINNRCFLLDVWRGRVAWPQLIVQTKAVAAKWKPNHILIEDKASGQSLLQALKFETGLPVLPIDPGGKSLLVLAHAATGLIESGRVYIPESDPWLYDWLEEHHMFPSGRYDDQVVTTVQFLNWVRPRISGGTFRGVSVEHLKGKT